MTVSSVSFGHADTNPEAGCSRLCYHPCIQRSAESLTGWVKPQNEGNRQSLDFRALSGRERSKELVGGPRLILSHTDNILHVTTVSEKRVSARRYDQSLNLREFDTFKSIFE